MTEPRNNGVTPSSLRIGSRGSELALWQANHVAASLRTQGHEVQIEIIHTTGDKITDVPLAQVGTKGGLGKGVFTKEIEEALAAGRVDLAVHSLKDLPTELPAGFEIAAVTKREDPRDAFCSRLYSTIEDLPQGARVGTSSLRRQAQLKAIRPDLDIYPLRGNVDTRLRKLEEGEYAAIILASAGLKRLGKMELVKQIIPAGIICPAAGQGALAIQIRQGDDATHNRVAFLDDVNARATTTCERALLQSMGGGCQVPIGAFAEVTELAGETESAVVTEPAAEQRRNAARGASRGLHGMGDQVPAGRKKKGAAPIIRLHLEAIVAHPDGSKLLRESRDGNDPEKLGAEVGHALLRRGGDAILEEVYGKGFALPAQP